MEKIIEVDLHKKCLDNFISIKNSLVDLSASDFDKKAANIATIYGLDIVVVRAIGRDKISSSLSVIENSKWIRMYINFPNTVFSVSKKKENLANVFNVSEDIVEKIANGKNVSVSEIEEYRNFVEEEISKSYLTEDDKEFIREYIAEAETDEEKKRRRKECAEDFNVKIAVISAVTAWTKIRSNKKNRVKISQKEVQKKADKKRSQEKKESKEVFETIEEEIRDRVARAYAKGGQEAANTEKKSLTKEVNKTRRQIDAIAAWLKIKPQENVPAEILSDFLAQLEKENSAKKNEKKFLNGKNSGESKTPFKREIPKTTQEDNNEVTEVKAEIIEKNGAHFEYNNEIKNKWRQKMKEFIAERIPETKRSQMKVLCLPGKDWIEVKNVYLDLGVKPENIWGVEREKSVKDIFEENAAKLGCQTYFGKMADFLEETNERFNIVSLDFLGPLSLMSVDIFKKLKLSDNPLIMTNFMAKRENKMRDLMKDLTGWAFFTENNRTSSNGAMDDIEKRQGIFKKEEMDISMKDARERGVLEILQASISTDDTFFSRKIANIIPDKIITKEGDLDLKSSDAKIEMVFLRSSQIADLIADHLGKNHPYFQRQKAAIAIYLQNIVKKSLFNYYSCTNLRKFSYKNKKGSNYFSDFYEFKNHSSDFYNLRHSAGFVINSALEVDKYVNQKSTVKLDLSIKDKHGHIAKTNEIFKSNTKLEIKVKGKIFSLSVKKLTSDIAKYYEIGKENLADRVILGLDKFPEVEEIY